MEVMSYSQKDGFSIIDDFPDWDDNDDEVVFANKLGFTLYDSDQIYLSGESSRIIAYYFKEVGDWRYMTIMDNAAITRIIVTENQAEDFALRLLLLPMVGTSSDSLHRLNDVLDKLFRLYHGHEPFIACDDCDPAQAKVDRDIQRSLR